MEVIDTRRFFLPSSNGDKIGHEGRDGALDYGKIALQYILFCDRSAVVLRHNWESTANHTVKEQNNGKNKNKKGKQEANRQIGIMTEHNSVITADV